MLRTLPFSLGLLAFAASPLVAQDDAAPKTYSAKQFYESVSYGLASPGPNAFSPDGAYVLISSDLSGVFNVYRLPLDGGEAEPLTRSTQNATYAISYFPGDERVLFTADNGGDELNHIFVREADGTDRDLTPGEGHKADFAGWRGDGKSFYVISNERDAEAFDVYAYDPANYSRELIFTNPGGYLPGAVAPDGKWLVLDKPNSSADNDLFLVDLADGGEPMNITPHEGDVSFAIYDFTPDGKSLLFGTDEDGEFVQAYSYDIASGATASVLKADWDVSYVVDSPSGRYRVSAINEDASSRLTITDTNSGQALALTGLPEGDIGQVRFTPDESAIAFSVTSDTSPTDIYTADLASGAATRLTSALNPAIDEGDLVTATVARFKSYDGLEIPGIL